MAVGEKQREGSQGHQASAARADRNAAADRLGADVLEECRSQLMLKFRFLDLALWRMDLTPARAGARFPLACDGARVFFDPERVIARFQESFAEEVRDYLHLVLHCIFRHPFDTRRSNREAWSLTCDILVESAAMDICGHRFESALDAARAEALSTIALQVGTLVPEKVYDLVSSLMRTPAGHHHLGMGASSVASWRALFERDDHGAWPAFAAQGAPQASADGPVAGAQRDEGAPDGASETFLQDASTSLPAPSEAEECIPEDGFLSAGEDDASAAGDGDSVSLEVERASDAVPEMLAQGTEGADSSAARAHDAFGDEDASTPDNGVDSVRDAAAERDEQAWTDIAKQVEVDLETFSREWGDAAGSLKAQLALANRPRLDYTDFLRRFMTQSEELKVNADEFDYIFYTYGLKLYGNMPLVEPLEYGQSARVRDFVIAVDTSESVRGDLVRRFLAHTFAILKESQDFSRAVNIHVVQCDARMQSDLVIRDMREVDAAIQSLTVRGFGGTDFRPVFDYVSTLRRTGELADLRGLVYFTDGLGRFPEKPPDYDVAFVFMDDDGAPLPAVPPWACKIVIDERGIRELEHDSISPTNAALTSEGE